MRHPNARHARTNVHTYRLRRVREAPHDSMHTITFSWRRGLFAPMRAVLSGA